jgi:menaquinone-dependent protoporphyrinogen oxidase
MSKRVLVGFVSNAGSTEEVAREIGESLRCHDVEVEVRRLSEVDDVSGYDAAVIGAPMIVGWHRRATRFIRRHQDPLNRIPVACFMTALTLTDSKQEDVKEIDGIEIYRDPQLLKSAKNPDRLSFKERHSSLAFYLKPLLRKALRVRPVGIALFAGKLDYRKLKFLQMVFVMLLFAEKPRDYRNWEHIRSWAAETRPRLLEHNDALQY